MQKLVIFCNTIRKSIYRALSVYSWRIGMQLKPAVCSEPGKIIREN